ncbi:hypothetical protein Cgig2_009350 [Carnegiea gigantea]|uniref:Uncharacterized protein n=1 Tax=Carnegiea gigantea TaxID=171969 RepID=A0A9Q1JKR2_9CARY|nr:hypothetical protein Cgig2_009350 [Carnegiea gigantea]
MAITEIRKITFSVLRPIVVFVYVACTSIAQKARIDEFIAQARIQPALMVFLWLQAKCCFLFVNKVKWILANSPLLDACHPFYGWRQHRPGMSTSSYATSFVCYSSPFLVGFHSRVPEVNFYDVRGGPPWRLECTSNSPLQRQDKDDNNMNLCLTEPSNWIFHWLQALVFEMEWFCLVAFLFFVAVYLCFAIFVDKGCELLWSSLCLWLALTYPFQVCWG